MENRNGIQALRKILCCTSMMLASVCASAAWGQSSHHRFDLTDFLNQRGLTVGAIRGMATVVAPTDLPWSYGHSDEINNGYLSLTPAGGMGGPSGYALHVHYNPIFLQPVHLEGCLSSTNCIEVASELDPIKRSLNFTLDGNRWEMKIGEAPCKANVSCQFQVPSWALESRRLVGSSSLSPLPATTTIIDFGGWVALFNAANGKHWMDLRFPSGASSLGALQSAFMSEKGRLTLEFLYARIILDFAKDRAVLADSSGVAFSTAGIADLASGHWQYNFTKSDEQQAVLEMADDLVVWTDGFLIMNLDQDGGLGSFVESYEVWLTAAKSFNAEGGIDFFVLSDTSGGLKLKAYDPAEQSFGATGISWPRGSMQNSDILVRNGIVRLAEDGARILSDNGFVPTSLSMSNRNIYLLRSGSAFVEQDSGGQCRYVHYDQHVSDFGSFKESGFSAPCGLQASFHAAQGGVAAVSRIDKAIQVSVQRR